VIYQRQCIADAPGQQNTVFSMSNSTASTAALVPQTANISDNDLKSNDIKEENGSTKESD
jgi:hypothetical protein